MPATRSDLAPLWTATGLGVPVAPPLAIGDLVLSFHPQAVVATDLVDGTTRWRVRTTGVVRGAAGVGGRVYFLDDILLTAVDARTGAAQSVATAERRMRGTPVVAAGLVCTAGLGGLVIAVDPTTGAVVWTQTLADAGTPSPPDTRQGPLVVSPAGDVLFTQWGDTLVAVNVRSGDVRWRAALDGGASGPAPLALGGLVVAGAQPVALDAVTGEPRWRLAEPPAAPAVATTSLHDAGLVVLAMADGRVHAVDRGTGAERWVAALPTAPVSVAVSENELLASTAAGHVVRLTADGTVVADHALDPASGVGTWIVDGTIVAPTGDGLTAQSVAGQDALLLGGTASQVDLALAAGGGLAFATGDLTVEAWVRTSSGGELLSAFPAGGGGVHLRLNLDAQGSVRFGMLDATGRTGLLARTDPSPVCDGAWHHLAVVRDGEDVRVYLDADSLPVSLGDGAAPSLPPLAALTIGALRTGAGSYGEAYRGLLLDLRLWDRAVPYTAMLDRMHARLLGDEPGLVGYWTLDGTGSDAVANRVASAATTASLGSGAAARPTALALSDRTYPYLLDDVSPHWPYHGYWSVRGAHPPTTRAAVTDHVVVYGTAAELYAVNAIDGRRRWRIDAPRGVGHPVGRDGIAYFSDETAVVAVAARSGATLWRSRMPNEGLSSRMHPPAPVVDATMVAHADSGGQLTVYERADGARRWSWVPGLDDGDVLGLAFEPDANGDAIALAAYCGMAVVSLPVHPDGGQTPTWRVPVDSNGRATMAMAPIVAAGGSVVHVDAQDAAIVARRADTGEERWRVALAALDPAAPASARVTGLTALPDDDVVVVTTDAGIVYGVGFGQGLLRWTRTLPPGTGGSSRMIHPAVHTPVGTFCAATSGTMTAIDPVLGTLHGVFDTGAPIVSCAVGEAGTLFFACGDAGVNAGGDAAGGSLRSVVFGESYAIKLGLDEFGRPTDAANGAVRIANYQTTRFTLRDRTRCCVEAWINTAHGGDVMSKCPSSFDLFGLRLTIDGGAVHLRCIDSADHGASWTLTHAVADGVRVDDGRWHHVAACRLDATGFRIYVDGVAQDVDGTAAAHVPPFVAPGLQIALGADATQPPEARDGASQFRGLLGEVRVWDTTLDAGEVAERMHVKLRGSEADLIAYWNFDDRCAFDLTESGLNGSFPPNGFWLTDLVFDQPLYPWIMASADRKDAGSGGRALYELDLMVHRADGSMIAGHPLSLWYVRHDGEPETIRAWQGDATPTVLTGVAPTADAEDPPHAYAAVTGQDGHLRVLIETTAADHGPTLDVRAGFMPANERFLVSVLTSDQLYELPTPPRLTAQSRLIQDYHYAYGDRIDAGRDRTTYRTVLSVRNADGSPRPGERLTVSARAPLTVEHRGERARIDDARWADYVTGADGDVVLVTEATDVATPELLVHAAFMHRNDQLVVTPNHDVTQSLRTVTADQLTATGARNWSPDGGRQGAVLTGEFVAHATEIAATLRHVASAAPTPVVDPGDWSAPAGDDSERQAPPGPGADAALTARTMRHIGRTQPLTPEDLHQSLRKAAGEGINGFHIILPSPASPTFQFDYTTAVVALAGAVATPTTPTEPVPQVAAGLSLGGFFSDAWDGIKSAGRSIYDGARSIIVSVGRAITVAIDYATHAIQTVIDTLKDAVDLIAGFVKQIGLAIKELIDFLRALFDWGAILDTHDRLRDATAAALTALRHTLTERTADVKRAAIAPLDRIRTQLAEYAGLTPRPITVQQGRTLARDARFDGTLDVKSRTMLDRVTDHADRARISGPAPSAGSDVALPDPVVELAGAIRSTLGEALADPGALASLDVGAFVRAIAGALSAAIAGVEVLVATIIDEVAGAIDLLIAALSYELHIPFVSELYAFITRGSTLTLLDVISLLLALPVHVVHVLITGESAAPGLASLESLATQAYSASSFLPASTAGTAAAAGTRGVEEGAALPGVRRYSPDELRQYTALSSVYFVSRILHGATTGFADIHRADRLRWGEEMPGVAYAQELPELLLRTAASVLGLTNAFARFYAYPPDLRARDFLFLSADEVGYTTLTLDATFNLGGLAMNVRGLLTPEAQRTGRGRFEVPIAAVQSTIAITKIVRAIVGRVTNPDDVGDLLTVQVCTDQFAGAMRLPLVYLRNAVIVRVVGLTELVCGGAASALFMGDQVTRGLVGS